MKYKVININIKFGGVVHPEGSEIELSDEDKKGLENYLVPVTTSGKKLPPKPSKKDKGNKQL